MLRRLFTLASVLSLLLSAATLVLWVRTSDSGLAIERGGRTQIDLASERRSLALVVSHPGEVGEPWTPGWRIDRDSNVLADEMTPTNGQRFRFRAGGFEWASYRPAPMSPGRSGAGMRYWVVAVPHWFVCILLLIPLGVCILRKPRPAADRRCPRCGYDLRATPLRCPECGHVPKSAAGA